MILKWNAKPLGLLCFGITTNMLIFVLYSSKKILEHLICVDKPSLFTFIVYAGYPIFFSNRPYPPLR